jgi:hypothetical protein
MRSDGLDYQNVPYQHFRTETENLNKNSILSLYQDTQHHTYQNITQKTITAPRVNDNVSITHRATSKIQDLANNQIKLNKLPITSSIANGPDDDGLYEICGTQYPYLETNKSNQINNESHNVNTQNSSLNSTYIGINEYNSKFLVLGNLMWYRVFREIDLLIKNINECIQLIAGNHYGTPKPSKESKPTGTNSVTSRLPDEGSSSTPSSGGAINFPGAHPSSEGKRRRNRSNVEAMTAKNLQEDVDKEDLTTTNGKKKQTFSGIL